MVLIIDITGSMDGNDPYGLRLEAAKAFIDTVDEGDSIGLVAFNEYAYPLADMTVITSDEVRNDLKRHLMNVRNEGQTNLSAGLDEGFDQLIVNASRVNPIGEGVAFGLGAVLGVWIGQSWVLDADAFWLKLVLIPSIGLMFGLLLWTIYVALAGTRLNAALHRQPLSVDIFDTGPFWPVGRQSLIIALVFVGGMVLGMLGSFVEDSLLDWRNWLLYSLLALVAVLIFFLNMRPTHRVLAA